MTENSIQQWKLRTESLLSPEGKRIATYRVDQHTPQELESKFNHILNANTVDTWFDYPDRAIEKPFKRGHNVLISSSLTPLSPMAMFNMGWVYLVASDKGVNITRDHERLDYPCLTYEIGHMEATWVVGRSLLPRSLRARFWVWNSALLKAHNLIPPEHFEDAPEVLDKLNILIDDSFIDMFNETQKWNPIQIHNRLVSTPHYQIFQADTPKDRLEFEAHLIHKPKDQAREKLLQDPANAELNEQYQHYCQLLDLKTKENWQRVYTASK